MYNKLVTITRKSKIPFKQIELVKSILNGGAISGFFKDYNTTYSQISKLKKMKIIEKIGESWVICNTPEAKEYLSFYNIKK